MELFQVLRRRRLILLICVGGAAAIAAGIAGFAQKQYTAVSKLYFHDPMLTEQLFGSTVLPSGDPARAAATDLSLVQLRPIYERTARLTHTTADEVSSKVAVAAGGQSDLVSVNSTDASPEMASRLANAFAAEFVRFRRGFDRDVIRDTLRLIQQQRLALPLQERGGAVARSLSSKVGQLRILESLQTGNVTQVQRASVPTSPSSPRPVSDVALGLITGLLIGFGLSVLIDRLDRRLHDPEETQRLFARPLLGVIPTSRQRGRSPTPVVDNERFAEAFRLLRTNLRYFQLGREVSVVVATSAEPGDGKTTVCWNLAAAAASAQEKVLLIDADLRRPEPSGSGRPGLVQVLFGQSTLDSALVPGSAGVGRPTFDVLYAGGTPPNPADVLESRAMMELLESARTKYDLIVLDCTPIGLLADAIPLLGAVDGAIVVASIGKTTRDNCRRLRSELEELNAPVLGVVVNRVRAGDSSYGGYYASGSPSVMGAARERVKRLKPVGSFPSRGT